MRLRRNRPILSYAVLVMLGAGCATLMPQAPSTGIEGVITDAVGAVTARELDQNALMFVGQGYRNRSLIFNTRNQEIGSLPAPDGYFAVDSQGNFYDAVTNPNTLLLFSAPYHRTSATIEFGNDIPMGLAVDPRTNVSAVIIEAYAGGGPGPYYIRFYEPFKGTGPPTSCVAVEAPAAGGLAQATFDQEGTLYMIDYGSNGYNGIASIKGECKARTLEYHALPAGYEPDGVMQIDANDNLALQTGRDTVSTFRRPVNGTFEKPIATTVLKPQKSRFMFFTCFSIDGSHVWASEGRAAKTLFEFKYPGFDPPTAKIAVTGAEECAVTPSRGFGATQYLGAP